MVKNKSFLQRAAALCDELKSVSQDKVTSLSTTNPDRPAEINNVIANALCELTGGKYYIASGSHTDTNGRFLVIENSVSEKITYLCLINSVDAFFLKAVTDDEGYASFEKISTDAKSVEYSTFLSAAYIAQLLFIKEDATAKRLFSQFSCTVEQGDEVVLSNAIAEFSDYIYYKLIGRGKSIDFGDPKMLDETSIQKFVPSNAVNEGCESQYFGKKPKKKRIEAQIQLSKFSEIPLSKEEQALVPTIPDWYVAPEELNQIISLVINSSNTNRPVRNLMFRGPSSTGKTSLARAIAAKLQKPYMFITCSADTESYDFLGQPMYDENGKVKFVESPFIAAIKNGYVIEIQEPYVIAKQGVLTALNGLLDDSAGITLSTGEVVKRHPDTVVILTTNVNYVGCRLPNQSVIRRMNAIYDVNLPEAEEIKERVVAVTGFADKKLLNQMVKLFYKVNEKLEAEDVTDGICSITELIDWCESTMLLKSVTRAALFTIISKSTCDLEMQAEIANIISASLEGMEYNG